MHIAVPATMDRFLTKHFSRPSISWQVSCPILFPLIGENLFTLLFGLVNMGMISASGAAALSAVSLVDTLTGFLSVFYVGISTGACIVLANYRGRGDGQKLHESCVQAVTVVTLFATATMLVIFLLHKPMLHFLFGAAEAEVMEQATLYFLGVGATLPLQGIITALCGVLKGIGEGKTSLLFIIISTIFYSSLNVLFLNGMDMGIQGVVLATVINRLCCMPLYYFLMKLHKSSFLFRFREFFHIDRGMLRSIVKMGMPCAVEQMFFTGGRLVTQSVIVPMGTNAIVTYNISYSLMSLNQALVNPVNSAMYTIAGICMGNRRTDDVRALTKSYIWMNTASYVLSLGLVVMGFDWLVAFYNASAEIIPMIFVCVMITGVLHPIVHSAGFTLPSVFRAVGDGNYCTVSSLLIMWGVRVFGGWLLGSVFGIGIMGIWIAMGLDWVVRAIVYAIRFRGDRWLSHQVISE